MLEDIYHWFARTSDFWGVVIGSAVGVVFGYLASVVHQWWDDKRDRQMVRRFIRQEYLLNLRAIRRLTGEKQAFRVDLQSKTDEAKQRQRFQRHQGQAFAYGPRPYWSRAALSAHLQRFPDVLDSDEAEKVLSFYHGLEGICAFWDRLHSALVIDLNTPTQKEVDFVFDRKLVPNIPHELDDTIDRIWPELEKLMSDLSRFPDTIVS